MCLNVAEGRLAPGMLGFCRDLPGGWGEFVVARQDRLHEVPDDIPDDHAVLAEPFAVAVSGVRKALRSRSADRPRAILVVGAGTVGLLTVMALRLAGFTPPVHVVARYSHQARLASQVGGSEVHASAWEAAEAVGARRYRSIIGPPASRGGFDLVIDAAGSEDSIEQASWAVREGGTVLLLGSPGIVRHDLSPYWFRQVRLIGSYTYSRTDIADAVRLLADGGRLEGVVTHRYPLSAWRQAFRAVRGGAALKVLFSPG
jgi:threonine dehydrogenase-like Zn-dependent dehydrogenase